MRNVLAALVIGSMCQASFAAGNVTYLSCPELDKRADDLLVVMDQQGGTASVQSKKSGSGLNFTAPASFGPAEVIWRSDSASYAQLYSVNRESLVLKRETTSAMSGTVYNATSNCTIVKAPQSNKF